MGLRAQVLLIGLLTLSVPVLGWQSVRELHLSLQQTRIEAQTLRVANLRAVLAGDDTLTARLALGDAPSGDAPPGHAPPGDARVWYAESARWPLFVDGYADDWQSLVGAARRFAGAGDGGEMTVRVARRGERLFLFVAVIDDDVVHHVPPRLDAAAGENEQPDRQSLLVNGDALEVLVEPAEASARDERSHALLRVIAPGRVRVLQADARSERRGGVTRVETRALPRWRAEWVDNTEGYQVEISLPLPAPGSGIDIVAIDVAHSGGSRERWLGSVAPRALREVTEGAPLRAPLLYESDALRERLAAWVSPGTRARLFDTQGRLLAEVDALYQRTVAPDGTSGDAAAESAASPVNGLLDAVLLRLFTWFAAGDLPLFPETEKRRQPLHLSPERLAAIDAEAPTRRYVTVDNDRVLGTLVDVPVGDRDAYLLFESNEEHVAAVTGGRLARLFASLVFVSLAITALLLIWATGLSLRVRRLARGATRAIDAQGRHGAMREVAPLIEDGARDEIGALSRDVRALLARSAAYTRYLERLSARLSHEIGTPLSIVRSSLENLDDERLDDESRTLVRRAANGGERLAHIVRALVASTRLEHSVRQARFTTLDLAEWLGEAREQYAQIHPEHTFRLIGSLDALDKLAASGTRFRGRTGRSRPRAWERPATLRATVAATLLQQALDKLVTNAVDFATDGDIMLLLTREAVAERSGEPRVTLAVVNTGAALGARRRARMFEPDWSSRAGAGASAEADRVHGGLGLHIVTLVAEAHGGRAFALERPLDARASRLVIGLHLPLMPDENARREPASHPPRA